jgi:hypothetical protein
MNKGTCQFCGVVHELRGDGYLDSHASSLNIKGFDRDCAGVGHLPCEKTTEDIFSFSSMVSLAIIDLVRKNVGERTDADYVAHRKLDERLVLHKSLLERFEI